jgi:two-component system response regulator (stage 0 sporulation protein F)
MQDAPRILVVDDEPGPREALREILHPKYQVMLAENGSDALQLFSTSPADLVLLDLRMPGMDGIDVLKAIKEVDATVEAIMITAYASLETVEEAVTKALSRRAARTAAPQEVRTLLAQLLTLTQSAAADSAAAEPVSIILSQVQRLIGATTVLLYLHEASNPAFDESVALDCPPRLRVVLDSPAWAEVLRQTLAAGQVVLMQTEPSATESTLLPALAAQGYTAALLCPMHLAAESTGVLACLVMDRRPWHADSIALVQTMVELLALALHTQQRYQAAQQTAAQHGQRATQLSIQRASPR